jgi:hypothetical protein
MVSFFKNSSGKQAGCPTKRAPDAGDSGAIPSIFLRLSIFPVGRCSAARPSAGNANRWKARQRANAKPSLNRKFHFSFISKKIRFYGLVIFLAMVSAGFSF